MLLESVDILTEYLHEELREFAEGAEISKGHVAFHLQRLTQWRNQGPEPTTGESHNGWRNYETWLVALWLSNDRGLVEYWETRAEELIVFYTANSEDEAEGMNSLRVDVSLALAREMKSELEAETDSTSGFINDLLNSALGQVYWYEIASNFLNEAVK